MLKTRRIPCLHVADGRVVKGVKFVNLIDTGDPIEAAQAYDAAGADELCFLDIHATHENRSTMYDLVTRTVADDIDFPVIASGGVSSLTDLIALRETKVISGAISGRALYEGAIDLRAALRALRA